MLHVVVVVGPDAGALSNTKQWKKTTPQSTYSPYILQGDIGFFSYNNKQYGQFLCCVNTFTRRVYAAPIRNLKSDTLIEALGKMLKQKEFQNANTLLFDGESGLRGRRIQNIVQEKYGLKIHAEPHFKRSLAERAIKEIKLRTSLLLEMEGACVHVTKKNLKNKLPPFCF